MQFLHRRKIRHIDITISEPEIRDGPTTVVCIKANMDGEIVQDCEIYIGRKITTSIWISIVKENEWWNSQMSSKGTIWSNPFVDYNKYGFKISNSEDAVYAYWWWINQPEQTELKNKIPKLKGCILGCSCKMGANVNENKPLDPLKGIIYLDQDNKIACHGDILKYLADGIMTPILKEIIQKHEANGGLRSIMYPIPVVPKIVITSKPRVHLDKVRGGFWSLALGDALGLPFELYKKPIYYHELKYKTEYFNMFTKISGKEPIKLGIGQYSDNTEMAISLARSLIDKKEWNYKDVVNEYMELSNSNMPMMSKNIKTLFKDNDYEKYVKEYKKLYGIDPSESYNEFCVKNIRNERIEKQQNNDSLIRCFPLACLWNDECAEKDCCLTNPSSANCAITKLYVSMLRLALSGYSAKDILKYAVDQSNTNSTISKIFFDIKNNISIDVSFKETKSWIGNPFYLAILCLMNLISEKPMTFPEMMSWIIKDHYGSDTDTNASVVGALIGSIIGWDELVKNKTTKDNYTKMYNMNDTELIRPLKYRLNDIDDICEQLVNLSAL